MLTSEYPPDSGGISYYVYEICKRLHQRGHKITVLTRGPWNRTYLEEKNGIHIYRIQYIPVYPSPFWLHGLRVNKILASIESECEVLHIHGSLVPSINAISPIVYTIHAAINNDIDNRFSQDFRSYAIKIVANKLIKNEQSLCDSARVITAVSNSAVYEFQKTHFVEGPVDIIPSGVDYNLFSPAKQKTDGLTYVLYVGRLEPIKGLVNLIGSAQYVCSKYNNLKFILVGKGTMERALKGMVNKLRLNSYFYFAGNISDRMKLLDYYQNASVFVLPSYYESSPLVLREAMSCSLPVVATNVGGISEIINDNENGLLVSPNSSQEIATALMRLLEDKQLRERLGTNARNTIKQFCDWESIVDKIEIIYQNCK